MHRFNDVVNGFNGNGYSIPNCDGADDVIIVVNSKKKLSSTVIIFSHTHLWYKEQSWRSFF